MSRYHVLLNRLNELSSDIAVFRKVVLHAHTPDSYDVKGKTEGDYRKYETELQSIDIDLISFTDHMRCGFSCLLSKNIDKSVVCILPGVEINIVPPPPWDNLRLHILAIFPQGYSEEQIGRIFPPDIPPEKDRTGKEFITTMTIQELVNQVQAHNGLCIAAHIDSTSGVRAGFRQIGKDGLSFLTPDGEISEDLERSMGDSFKNWLITLGFNALELASDKDKSHYQWTRLVDGKYLSLPTTLSCDAHTIEDLKTTNKFTYIKMSDISFYGLKEALSFPDTRIRFPSELVATTCPRILGIEIVSGDDDGFFRHLELPLSENLNCFIGPRGSGKSTIIESIRYIFGYNRSLGEIEESGDDIEVKVRDLQKATLSNCIIRVVYCKRDEQINVLETTFDPDNDYTTTVFDTDGVDLEVSDVEVSDEFPLRLYGWSEIETLGRSANRQRNLLDRLVHGLPSLLDDRREIITALIDKSTQIISNCSRLETIFSKNSDEVRRFKEYKAEFDKLNTDEAKLLFKNIDITKKKKEVLSVLYESLSNLLDEIEEVSKFALLEELESIIESSPDEINKWWIEKSEELKVLQKEAEISSHLKTGILSIKSFLEIVQSEKTTIDELLYKYDGELRDTVSDEAARQVATDLRRLSAERLERVEGIRKEYLREWHAFNANVDEWKALGLELQSKHDEISGRRASKKDEVGLKINDLIKDYMTISIDLKPGKDRDTFIEHLNNPGFFTRELHGNFRASNWPLIVSSNCNPLELAQAILDEDASIIEGTNIDKTGVEWNLDDTISNRIISTLNPYYNDEDAQLPRVVSGKIRQVLELGAIDWDDYESIKMDDKPIENLSPGQRSSAMLPLITLVEDIPLVIDQPEDNLDNRLIGEVLVSILANLKEKRQIIVATHNPNIVVLGDSEQVVVFNAKSDSEGEIEATGSIDKDVIVKSVINIMEGGEEAFKLRKRRYKIEDVI